MQAEEQTSSLTTEENPTGLESPLEIAKRLSVDRKKVYRMIKKKIIPAVRVDGGWRLSWSDVLGALKKRSEAYGNQGS